MVDILRFPSVTTVAVLVAVLSIQPGACSINSHHHTGRNRSLTAVKGRMRFNLVMVKVPKVGSSTLGGVARRIAAHHSMSGYTDSNWIFHEPGVWAAHLTRAKLPVAKLKLPSFVFSVVRDPLARAMSEFYHFRVTRKSQHTNDAHRLDLQKVAFLRNVHNLQMRHLDPVETFRYAGSKHIAQRVFDAYDFVAVTERFDESMLLLAHRLGVPWSQVLYVPSKVAADGRQERFNGHTFTFVPHPAFVQESAEVQLELVSFRRQNHLDYELHRLANQRLDQLIAEYGEVEFRAQLAEFQRALAQVAEECVRHDPPGLTFVKAAGPCYWR
jgi:Sulfotransferase family